MLNFVFFEVLSLVRKSAQWVSIWWMFHKGQRVWFRCLLPAVSSGTQFPHLKLYRFIINKTNSFETTKLNISLDGITSRVTGMNRVFLRLTSSWLKYRRHTLRIGYTGPGNLSNFFSWLNSGLSALSSSHWHCPGAVFRTCWTLCRERTWTGM